jgi:hypothetical protein
VREGGDLPQKMQSNIGAKCGNFPAVARCMCTNSFFEEHPSPLEFCPWLPHIFLTSSSSREYLGSFSQHGAKWEQSPL